MSKVIKITEQEIEALKHDFEEALNKAKLSDGKFTFTKNVGEVDRKAKLFYTEKAWLKQDALVREFTDEVAWHGVAKRRGEDEDDEYVIEDILVYPQEVTGATVTTDQEKYQDWLYDHDDEVFNNIRMQGHSHVNMGVTPSRVDLDLYEDFLNSLDDDMFYIFLIWNKKGEKTVKIYDLKKNVLFETKDVDVFVEDEIAGLSEFIEESKKQVTRKTVTTPVYNRTQTRTTAPVKAAMNATKGKKGKAKSSSYSGYDYGYGYYGDRYW